MSRATRTQAARQARRAAFLAETPHTDIIYAERTHDSHYAQGRHKSSNKLTINNLLMISSLTVVGIGLIIIAVSLRSIPGLILLLVGVGLWFLYATREIDKVE